MNINIIALGKIKEKYIKEGVNEFLKRLKPYSSFTVTEISPIEIKDENLTERVLNEEGEKILAQIKPDAFVVTLEINGKILSSEEFAQLVNSQINSGVSELVFVIGSSNGLSKTVSARANYRLSLSKMTFLHEFARLILLEQIYRAYKIIRGEKYHK